jgi:hypothetical protein
MLAIRMRENYDDALLRRCMGPGGPFEAQIFYASSRRPRNRLTNALDEVNCLHGHYPRVGDETIALAPGLRVRRLRLARGADEATVVFWLQSRGQTSAGGFEHLLWQYRRDLLLRRSDGCFVKIAYDGPPSEARDAALSALAREIHAAVAAWLARRRTEGAGP